MATDEANWCRVDAAPLDAAVTVYILSSSWTESPAVSQLLLLRQLHANRYYIIQLFTTMTLELTNSNDKKHICNELQKTFTVNFIYQGQSQQKLKKNVLAVVSRDVSRLSDPFKLHEIISQNVIFVFWGEWPLNFKISEILSARIQQYTESHSVWKYGNCPVKFTDTPVKPQRH